MWSHSLAVHVMQIEFLCTWIEKKIFIALTVRVQHKKLFAFIPIDFIARHRIIQRNENIVCQHFGSVILSISITIMTQLDMHTCAPFQPANGNDCTWSSRIEIATGNEMHGIVVLKHEMSLATLPLIRS